MCLHLLPLNQLFVMLFAKHKLFISLTLCNLRIDNKSSVNTKSKDIIISSCPATGAFIYESNNYI